MPIWHVTLYCECHQNWCRRCHRRIRHFSKNVHKSFFFRGSSQFRRITVGIANASPMYYLSRTPRMSASRWPQRNYRGTFVSRSRYNPRRTQVERCWKKFHQVFASESHSWFAKICCDVLWAPDLISGTLVKNGIHLRLKWLMIPGENTPTYM